MLGRVSEKTGETVKAQDGISYAKSHISIFLDTKGTFHAKMDIIKDRNGMDLTEAEDIKKR